ncbi:MAG: hypothetical protein U1F43_00845 [Myxococcota bacterium]
MEQSHILSEALKQQFRNHGDVFVAADIPLVFEDGTTVTPTVLVAINTSDEARTTWSVADEGGPDILIVAAGSPADVKDRYESIGVRELFVIDYAAKKIVGYWLAPRGFALITPHDNGFLPSEELRLDLGFHEPKGVHPIVRFFTRRGEILETPAETEAIRRARIARLIETHEIEIDEHDKDHK